MIKPETHRAARIFRALGHPIRLMIVRGLKGDGCNVNKIVAGLKMPQSTVSQHLSVLKSAGIVRGERQGVKVCYRVIDELARKIVNLF